MDIIVSQVKPDIILYGTGWQVNFSSIVKSICIKYTIKSIALIDHWARYKERFFENSLPNAILVMDDIANKKAKELLNTEIPIFQTKNYYIENIIASFSLIENKIFDSIVFISQPTVVDKIDSNAYEYALLEDILAMFNQVVVRLHPTENKNKYNEVIAKFPKKKVSVVESYEEDLTITLSKSKLTIGIGSMALYISYILGIKTVSYISDRHHTPNIPLPKKYILTNLRDVRKLVFEQANKSNLYSKSESFDTVLNVLLKG
ncbi:MAG: hypothetical protein JKX75_02255 [Gammaproteobacteria bacterium]|nr:hypothetical protein [Gammaproteobacteria bacterium]